MATTAPVVSIIVPVHNAEATIEAAVLSVLWQDYEGPLEVVLFDDGSSDASPALIDNLEKQLSAGSLASVPLPDIASELSRSVDDVRSGSIGAPSSGRETASCGDSAAASGFLGLRTLIRGRSDRAHGPGFARNEAVLLSSGQFLCLLDADDVMAPQRVRLQLELALKIAAGGVADATLGFPGGLPQDVSLCLIGCGFTRLPIGSTAAYAAWCNELSPAELHLQQWRECTLIQPSWFMHRRLWDRLGGWDELPPPFCSGAPAETDAASIATAGGSAAGGGSASSAETDAAGAGAGRRADSSPTPTAGGSAPASAYGILARPPLRLPREHEDGGAALRSHVFSSFPEDTLFFHRHLHLSGCAAAAAAAPAVAAGAEGSASAASATIAGPAVAAAHSPEDASADEGPASLTSSSSSAAAAATRDDDASAAAGGAGAVPKGGATALRRGAAAPILLARVPLPLLMYRYTDCSQSWRIPRQLLLRVRVALFEERVLRLRAPPSACSCSSISAAVTAEEPATGGAGAVAAIMSASRASRPLIPSKGAAAPACECARVVSPPGSWPSGAFTIWGAGRDGKAFYNALSEEGKQRVAAFADIDDKKIGQRYPPPPRGVPASASNAADAPMSKRKAKAAARALQQAAAAASPHDTISATGKSQSDYSVDADAVVSDCPVATSEPAETKMPAAKRARLSVDKALPAPRQTADKPVAVASRPTAKATSFLTHPIIHFTKLHPPAVICVAIGSGGRGDEVRDNVSRAGLTEGTSAWFFV